MHLLAKSPRLTSPRRAAILDFAAWGGNVAVRRGVLVVIFLIILILFILIAAIAYLIYYLQTRMAVGGTASSVSDMTEP